jgi:hypothetical protein
MQRAFKTFVSLRSITARTSCDALDGVVTCTQCDECMQLNGIEIHQSHSTNESLFNGFSIEVLRVSAYNYVHSMVCICHAGAHQFVQRSHEPICVG